MKKKELEKIVDFLCRYNKDDVVTTFTHFGYLVKEIKFKYLYNGKLMESEGVVGMYSVIVSNDKEKAIIRVGGYSPFSEGSYYELDKRSAKLIDITNYYKPNKENNNGK